MNWKPVAFVVLLAVAVTYALRAPGADSFMNPIMAKLLFFHLPCAFIATWFIILAAWFGARFLMTGEQRFDARNEASVRLALWFSVLTMGSGIVFSRLQWNAWWSNDPRQTSFLIVLLLTGAALALRGGLVDEQKSAKACSAYSVATVLPMMFLIFVLPRIMASLHPSDTIPKGKLDSNYWIGVALGMAVMGWIAGHYYYKIVKSRTAVVEDAPVVPVTPVPVSNRD